MLGINIAERGHIVNIIPPVDIDTTSGVSSDIFSMKNYSHATIIVTGGVLNADAGNITVEACNDLTASTAHTEIGFSYYAEETALGDTLGARTTVLTADAATGIDVTGTDNVMYVIEIDASELPAGKGFLRITWSNPGGSSIGSAVAILTGARYGGDQSATAIA